MRAVVARGYCPGHYRHYRNGQPLHRLIPAPSRVLFDEEEVYIEALDKHGHRKAKIWFDGSDYLLVSKHRWHVTSCSYAANNKIGYLPRFLMVAPDGLEVDHIDGNPLNSRRRTFAW